MRGREDPNTTINRQSSAHQQNANLLACRLWSVFKCGLGSFVINFRGSEPILLGNPIILWFFNRVCVCVCVCVGGGGGSDPLFPPLAYNKMDTLVVAANIHKK